MSMTSKNAAAESELARRLRFFEEQWESITDTIRQLVEIESPSNDKAACDRMAAMLADRFDTIGARVELHSSPQAGAHVQADFAGMAGKPILLLGHYDTVYPLGTLASMPCRMSEGRLWGPGTLDMKGGIGLMLHVIAAIREWSENMLARPITVLLVSDEEVGSDTSRALTEKLALQSEAVLVLEPAQGLHGAVKTARKGVGEFEVKVLGKAAHAGLDFQDGESAVLELARQIPVIAALTDLGRGVTVNVGTIRGGTRVNVIPAEASAQVDMRIARLEDAAGVEAKLKALKPFNRNCRLEVHGGLNRPPMERTPGVAALYERARMIAAQLGSRLDEAAVGGGSDGNFTAGLGIPTLDGLGAVGEGAHATHESIVVAELPRRAAILSSLIEQI